MIACIVLRWPALLPVPCKGGCGFRLPRVFSPSHCLSSLPLSLALALSLCLSLLSLRLRPARPPAPQPVPAAHPSRRASVGTHVRLCVHESMRPSSTHACISRVGARTLPFQFPTSKMPSVDWQSRQQSLYIPTCTYAYQQTWHACMHACVHACRPACRPACLPADLPTYRRVCARPCQPTSVGLRQWSVEAFNGLSCSFGSR